MVRRPRLPQPVTVLVVATVVEVGLRTTSLPRVCRWLGVRLDLTTPATAVGSSPTLPRWAADSAAVVDRVLRRWPMGETCLRRCLVLGHRLRGLDPVLRIGVRRGPAGEFLAHSWLEIGGHSLDATFSDFAPLDGVR